MWTYIVAAVGIIGFILFLLFPPKNKTKQKEGIK